MSDGIIVIEVEEGLSSLAKEVKKCLRGGKVLLFAREDRAGEDAAAAFSLEGFSVVKRAVTDAFLMRHTIEREEVEFVRAVVGVGGLPEMEAAKAHPLCGKVPTFLFPTHLSALFAYKEDAGFTTAVQRLTVRADTFTFVVDRSLYEGADGVREGLGCLLALWTERMDEAYEELVTAGRDPSPTLDTLRKAFAFWRQTSDKPLSERILSTVLFLGASPSLDGKSATEFAFLAARKYGGRYDEYLFPAAYALLALYRYYLSDFPLECAVPPDRTANAARIEGLSGLSAAPYLTKGTRYADGYMERMHVTGEYREDFLLAIEDMPLAELCRLYRRSAGEPLGDKMSSEQLLELLSLTGEAVSGYALLKHIKMTGLLEPLLIPA